MTLSIIQAPSPNYWAYNLGRKIVCLHGTAGDLNSSLGWLRNPASQASANYLISLSGQIYCLVDPYKGYSAWGNGIPIQPDMSNPYIAQAISGDTNLNLVSISIEHEASSADMIAHRRPMPAAQLAASQALVRQLCKDFNLSIVISRIVGHYQIDSVSRANCPGVIDVPGYVSDMIAQDQAAATSLSMNGYTIRGEILLYWKKLFNPVLTCGLPLTNEFVDGDGKVTQVFERAVLKFYPDLLTSAATAPWCVQGVLLGSQALLKAGKQPQPSAAVAIGAIGAYYQRLYNPTLICGYPISAPFKDADGRVTQYFERTVLKEYPEYTGTDWQVQGVRQGASWLPAPKSVLTAAAA